MIAASEVLVAPLAFVGPLAGVLAIVARQLVGSSEFPAAVRPIARERFLAGVHPNVGFQVRPFVVDLVATVIVTRVERFTDEARCEHRGRSFR